MSVFRPSGTVSVLKGLGMTGDLTEAAELSKVETSMDALRVVLDDRKSKQRQTQP